MPGPGVAAHRGLELVRVGVAGAIVDEAQLMVADGDDVTVLQSMLLDQLAVDVGAVGAVQILQEGVIQDVDDQGVMSADGGIVDAHIVVWQPADRVPLLAHVVLGEYLTIQTEDQSCH